MNNRKKIKIKDIAQLKMGQSPSSNYYTYDRSSIPFYQGVADFGERIPNTSVYCTKPIKIAHKGDVLFTVRAPVGEVNISTEDCCIGRGIASLTPKGIDTNYLFYLLQYIKPFFKSISNGTTYEAVNKNDIDSLNIEIFLSREDCDKTGFILSAFDNIIENNYRCMEILEEMSDLLFKEWFVEFRFPEYKKVKFIDSRLGKIPANWLIKPFGSFAFITDYVANGSFASLKANVKYSYSPDYAVLIRLTDYKKGWNGDYVYVTRASYEFLKKSFLKTNDVVISNVGEPGIVFRVPDLERPMTLGPNAVVIKDNKNQDYLYHYFKSQYGRWQLQSIISGVAQPKFNKTELRKILIIIPDKDILNVFCNISSYIFNLIDNLRKQNTRLSTIQDLILPRIFSGEIDISVLNIETKEN